MTAAHRIEPEQSPDEGPDSVESTENAASNAQLVPQKHGGALWRGPAPGRAPSPGRPKDELRARLLEIGREQAAPFLHSVLSGKVNVELIGTCAHCAKETPMTLDGVTGVAEAVARSIDSRIKASEQALKYGLGTQKEVSVQNVRDRMERTLELIQRMVEPETAKALIEAIRPVWS